MGFFDALQEAFDNFLGGSASKPEPKPASKPAPAPAPSTGGSITSVSQLLPATSAPAPKPAAPAKPAFDLGEYLQSQVQPQQEKVEKAEAEEKSGGRKTGALLIPEGFGADAGAATQLMMAPPTKFREDQGYVAPKLPSERRGGSGGRRKVVGGIAGLGDLETPTSPAGAPEERKLTESSSGGGGILGLGNLGALGSEYRKEDSKAAAVSQARQERAERVATLPMEQRAKAKQMTWEEYDALSPHQRAAVDFNSMLTQAVRRDMKRQDTYEPDEQQRKTYDATVERLFGEDGGSDIYAPETLAVLKQLEIKDESADIDDFLQLKTVITDKDLKNLDAVMPGPTQGARRQLDETDAARAEWQTEIVAKTGALQQSLAKGNELLATFKQSARQEGSRMAFLQQLGGEAGRKPYMPGFGVAEFDPNTGAPTNLDGYFQKAASQLSSVTSRGKEDELLGVIASGLKQPGDMELFMSYLDSATANAQNYGQLLGPEGGEGYRTPHELRVALGLDKR